MQKFVLIFWFLTFVFGNLNAQDKIAIRGIVVDSTGAALTAATVRLPLSQDTLTALTRPDGSFQFVLPSVKSVEILITMSGYAPYKKVFPIPLGIHSLNLLPLMLKTDYKSLDPVTVLAVKPIRIRQDTVEFYSAAFNVRPGDELEFLLKKFPGLHINMDGSVTFQGKKVTKLMLNGRDFVGADVATAIRNVPADIVESIQLIDDYGDKGRLTGVKSGDAVKVLNVVLKQDKRKGIFGRTIDEVGDKDKYNLSLFSGAIKQDRQLILNSWFRDTIPQGIAHEKGLYTGYSDQWNKRSSGSGSLGVWGDHYSTGTSTAQDIFLPGTPSTLSQKNQTTGNNLNIGNSYTLEYRPDPNSRLRVSPSFKFWKSSSTISSNLSSTESDSNFSKTNKGNIINLMNSKNFDGGSDIYFEKTYPSLGSRLSLTSGIHYSNRKTDGNQQSNIFVNTDGMGYLTRTHYLIHTTNLSRDFNTGLSYYLPLSKTGFLELSYTGQYSLAGNNKLTQTPDSPNVHLYTIDSLTNNYTYHSMTNRFHIGYIAHVGKLDMTLGADALPSILSGQTDIKDGSVYYHYFNILPVAQLSWPFTPARRLNLNYSGNTQLPQIPQLQPVTDLSNPQYPVTGNPFLKPSYTNSIGVQYQQSTEKPTKYPAFDIELKYNSTQNMIIANISHPQDTSDIVQRTTFSNVNGFNSLTADYNFEFPTLFHKHLRISTSGEYTYNTSINILDKTYYREKTQNWSQGFDLNLDLSSIIECELSGNYSQSSTRFSTGASSTSSFSTANWAFQGRYFLFKQWVLTYSTTQSFTSGSNGSLQANSAMLNISIQRQLFSTNQLTIRGSVYDLLNSNTSITQIVTPSSITQYRTELAGRYFLLGIVWKFEKFHLQKK